jgi:hypothetical protein
MSDADSVTKPAMSIQPIITQALAPSNELSYHFFVLLFLAFEIPTIVVGLLSFCLLIKSERKLKIIIMNPQVVLDRLKTRKKKGNPAEWKRNKEKAAR